MPANATWRVFVYDGTPVGLCHVSVLTVRASTFDPSLRDWRPQAVLGAFGAWNAG
jgi:hypothetical protein